MNRRNLLLFGITTALVGCGRKSFLHAPPALLEGGIHIKVLKAFAKRERVIVMAYVTNTARRVVHFDQQALALRLRDGEMVPHVGSRHRRRELPAGDGQKFTFEFRLEGADFHHLQQAAIIVAGVSFDNNPRAYVVGEVPLSSTPPSVQQTYGPPLPPPPVGNAPPQRPPPPAGPSPTVGPPPRPDDGPPTAPMGPPGGPTHGPPPPPPGLSRWRG